MTDKSNNLVHLRWLPLLWDFAECRAFFWGSAVLVWTYQSLSLAAQWGVTDIAGCTPLLMSWIYQRFPQWCRLDRGVYQYPLAARAGISMRSGSCVIGFLLTGYDLMSLHGKSTMTLPCRLYVRPGFVRRRSGGHGSQPSPYCASISSVFTTLIGKNNSSMESNRYMTTTGQGDYVWWPLKLKEWYDRWHQRFEPNRRIIVHHTFDTRPTLEYYDWWRGACHVRHLSGQEVLEDPRLAELPPDIQLTASQPRDDLTLPQERGHRERQVGKPVRRERARPRQVGVGVESDEEAEYAHQEEHVDIPQDREASPLPPPPSQKVWHSSGSGGAQPLGDWDVSPPGWHEGSPSGTHHEEDEMLDKILLDDAFHLHTAAPLAMDRIAKQFHSVRERSESITRYSALL
ncbi:hypothetical protein Ahy_A10g048108 [Arachis hypogaea]|uniref:Aminotransferase-like plant mobile domain-containing protein n=1 Tax=Arachis hypogaea TaxID=3818 RepID=A0A445B4C6_ARAHY|nr:hypothetical protein Ahy_A10g048108 [Arachis hypogaea]